MAYTDNRSQDSREQVRLKKILSDLLKLDANQRCAECDAKLPRWSSTNLGVFFCIRCSGIHRNLGVHISKVKSTNLDSWTQEQVDFMKANGNDKANGYWEANLPPQLKPKESDSTHSVEQFIRDKYERKKWVPRGSTGPGDVGATNGKKSSKSKSAKKKESSDEESSEDEEERQREKDRRRKERREKREREKAAATAAATQKQVRC